MDCSLPGSSVHGIFRYNGSSLNLRWPVLSWCWQRERPKGKEQRKKGLERSIATWPAREWGGRKSHSERRGVIWSAEREPKWGKRQT